MSTFGVIPRHKRRPVPPLEPAPTEGFLGYLVVTDTGGDRVYTTHTTLLDREHAEQELAVWHARTGCGRYAIAEVRLPGKEVAT